MGVAYLKNNDKDDAIKTYYKLKEMDEKLAKKLFAMIYS
jgi:hypothetical protein